ncbi:hypothetical protein B0I37DRAFT_391173 [Chaetomium sp. MPI-CAGE-AT-0009]|nr:hypothetical protein B0I37DRAFT_391173 [Chaetomium sp. MPI-CAGE-AT-0009]
MSAPMAEPLKASQAVMETPAPSMREQKIAEITAAQRTTSADLFRRGTGCRPGNPVPDRVENYNFRLGTDPSPSAYSFLQGKGHCADEVDAENKVFKTGSTTGTTYGRLSTIPADVRFTRTFPDAGRVSFLSRELVVLDETPDNRFANSGDSGAAIRNGTAMMVGMVWAGIESRCFDDGELVLIGPSRSSLKLSTITLCLPMEQLLDAMQIEIDNNFPGETVKLSPLPNSFGSSV